LDVASRVADDPKKLNEDKEEGDIDEKLPLQP
jgi:hypothetical protein